MLGDQVELSDESWRIAVLSHVLLEHPALLDRRGTPSRAARRSLKTSPDDAHDRAVRDLIAAGLLRREGDSIIPTRAAVHFYSLHS